MFFVFFRAACGILVPQPGTKSRPPAVEAQSPNHWTTREFPRSSSFFIFTYLFIYLVAPGLSCSRRAHVRLVGSFSCGMRTLGCGMHVGSSSLTRDRTRAPGIGSAES